MPATKNDWKTEPMPADRERVEVDRTYSDAERDAIAEGVVPGDQDDRWFVYTEDDRVHIHRSWTGHEIFSARLERDGDRWKVAEAYVNRDPDQREGGGGGEELAHMLDHLAAGGRL